ncbi:MAG: hypothetical protein JJT76_02065 [Clostridiaceae bacterium]|nr:hypothetical protein [Clostridiaceae bacterium]
MKLSAFHRYCMSYPPIHCPHMPVDAETYMKKLLMRQKGCKADILMLSREGILRNLLILWVDDGVVITEAEEEICVIPIKDISTIFYQRI